MASRLPTSGAIPIINEKGEMRMHKVKVQRYVSGRRPEYAAEKEEDEELAVQKPSTTTADLKQLDRRLQRTEITQERPRRFEAEVIEEDDEEEAEEMPARHERGGADHAPVREMEGSDEEEDAEIMEERRRRLREQAKQQQQQEELLAVEEEEEEEEEAEESEYETDDSGDNIPQFKPVFVSKTERKTIEEREKNIDEDQKLQEGSKRRAEERKKESHELLAEIVLQDLQAEQEGGLGELDDNDKENDEVRELLRIKRDREEREALERERLEIERIRDMTAEEKQAWLEANPKVVVNAADKGEYKFMQKYYHRGAFYLDNEDVVLKRNVDQPTLEDHFDKAALPKVMQVKNFGKKGRTKYTHLTDQDTTQKEAGWTGANPVNMRFENKRGGTKSASDVDAPFKRIKNY